jgi:hypothetical protein
MAEVVLHHPTSTPVRADVRKKATAIPTVVIVDCERLLPSIFRAIRNIRHRLSGPQ